MDATAVTSVIWYAAWPVFILVSYWIISSAVSTFEKKHQNSK